MRTEDKKQRPTRNVFVVTGLVLLVLVIAVVLSHHEDGDNQSSVSNPFPVEETAVFEPVLPDRPVRLPDDFAFHNEFQNEQWHYFANLAAIDGKQYSVQWSVYRIARNENDQPGWESPQIYLAYVIVTSGDQVWEAQRNARGGIGQAGFRSRSFRFWIDNWSWRSISSSPFPGVLNIETDEFSLKLRASAVGPFSLFGEQGYQRQHDMLPIAKYGFQAPLIRVSGLLNLAGKKIDVSGKAWLGKEWGNREPDGKKEMLTNLHLNDGSSLYIRQIRFPHHVPFTYGTLTFPSGKQRLLDGDDISLHALEYSKLSNGKLVPLHWKVKIPSADIELMTQIPVKEMWHSLLIPLWQGPVSGIGTHNAQGFLQLTGY